MRNSRNLLSFILLLCMGAASHSQDFSDGAAFMRGVDMRAYRGKTFKLQAAVRVDLIDPNADAEIWARIDKEDKKMGFFYNMMDKPIRSGEWKVYTIEGKIDKAALMLAFGGLFHRRGIFYYDQFRLSIREKGGWVPVELSGGDFEGDTAMIRHSWGGLSDRKGWLFDYPSDSVFEGKQCLRIDGSAFRPKEVLGFNPAAGKTVRVNGIDLYYEEYGAGAPLLLLHGNRESIISFEHQIPDLAKNFRVIAVDSRGQGRSTEDGRRYSYDLFAEDMHAFLDTLGLDSVNIFGWSDGGNTGLIMAVKYPQKVKKLAVMGANIFINQENVVIPVVFKILKQQQKEIKGDTSYHGNNERRFIELLLTEPRMNFTDLHAIRCPVLVMAGEKDVIKEEHTRAIASHISGSNLLILQGATHDGPSEIPNLVNAKLTAFFLPSL